MKFPPMHADTWQNRLSEYMSRSISWADKTVKKFQSLFFKKNQRNFSSHYAAEKITLSCTKKIHNNDS